MATLIKEAPAREQFPETRELKTHNHLIGNHAALNEAWEEDGYWFFRDVLDKDAVARLRQSWIDELEKQEVIDPVGDVSTAKSVRYNGHSLDHYPFRMEPLAEKAPWKAFVAEKPIHDAFTNILGDEPFWVPVVEYRATPPQQDRSKPRIDGIHQDGPYSPGIPFRICWIPLAEIDDEIGGLMLAEGMAAEKIDYLPKEEGGSNVSIPLDGIPAERWRRATYQAGDVLLMNLWTPHTGIANRSDRFRLSMDHRVMAKRDKCPIVGHVEEISEDRVIVRDEAGQHTLRIDPETYVRNTFGKKLNGPAITDFFRPGSEVIIAYDGDRASVVRPPH
ncbi:MAG: phytanoyl-CoA dioxygenase family protein [Sphingomonadaceae bacterium]|nr:phytanoyl-CoA dioxygenase family protein [Sphingomonadaceae bacterium]